MNRRISFHSLVSLSLLLCACSDVSTKNIAHVNVAQRELDQIAATYDELVKNVALPGEHESLADYFHRFSKDELRREGWSPHFIKNGDVGLSDDSAVILEISFGSCMLFESGSITTSEYTFKAAGHSEESHLEIQFTFGDPYKGSDAEGINRGA